MRILVWIFSAVAVLVAVSSGLLLIAGQKINEDNGVVEYTVNAFKFGYNPDVLTVKKGDSVKIEIKNTDVPHGIIIPDLNLKGEAVLEFTADKVGEFVWYCYIPCGSGHREMRGVLKVI